MKRLQKRFASSDKMIIIGLRKGSDEWQLQYVTNYFIDHGYDEFFDMIANNDYEVYDMSTYPEKGDAYDAITPSTPAVIALHLFGFDEQTRYMKDDSPTYFYNNDNYKIYLKTQQYKIPLFVWGDQPTGSGTGQIQVYNV